MIFIELKGRLGNNLFQIAFGSILKEKFSKRVIFIPKSEKIGNLKHFYIFKNFFLFKNLKFISFFWKLFFGIFKIPRYSYENQLYVVKPDDIELMGYYSGYFQNAQYLVENKGFLINLFAIRTKLYASFLFKYQTIFTGKRVLTIHVRLGDYLSVVFKDVSSLAFVGWDWYERALTFLNLDSFDHIFLISDDIELTQKMLGNNLSKFQITESNELTDFLLMRQSDSLVISNSSFAWWAAFLNEIPNKQVLAPHNWIGFNSGIEYPKGIMIDEFTWVK